MFVKFLKPVREDVATIKGPLPARLPVCHSNLCNDYVHSKRVLPCYVTACLDTGWPIY